MSKRHTLAIRRESWKQSKPRTVRVRSHSPHLGNRSLRRRSLHEHRSEMRTAARKRDQWISERFPAHRRKVDRQVQQVRSARSRAARAECDAVAS